MADLLYPAYLPPFQGNVQGKPAEKFTGIRLVRLPGALDRDFRVADSSGVISDQVVLKAAGVDIPFANGRVWLLRLADGYKAWEGWSDAAGNYTATGLELGVAYIPVAIDPFGNQKSVAAGPVFAT